MELTTSPLCPFNLQKVSDASLFVLLSSIVLDDSPRNYVHFSSACKGFLSQMQLGGSISLAEVVTSIVMTTHTGSARRREQVMSYARNPDREYSGTQLARRSMVEFFPNYDAMVAIAQKYTDPDTYAADIEYLLDPSNVMDIMGV